MTKLSKQILMFFTSIFAVFAICVTASAFMNNIFPVAIAAVGIAIYTIAGFIIYSEERNISWLSDAAIIRTAIALALIFSYIVLVVIFALGSSDADKPSQLAQTLVSNFTTIIGIVVAFYFGSSAYVQVHGRKNDKDKALQSTTEHGNPKHERIGDAPQLDPQAGENHQ